jgi:parallel beta-helix repeat protein
MRYFAYTDVSKVAADLEARLAALTAFEVSVRDVIYAGGAVGDSVHDDSPAFQAAANAVAAAGGGRIKVPKGVYRLATAIAWGSNIVVEGFGGDSSVINATGANINLFSGQNQSNLHFRNLKLNGGNVAAMGVLLSNCPLSSVTRCTITGFTGLNVSGYGGGVHSYLGDDVTIAENIFTGNGVLVGGLTSDIQINGNGVAADCTKRQHVYLNRCMSTLVQSNIICYDVARSLVAENICTGAKTQATNNNGYGIALYKTVNANAGTARRNRVVDNLVYSVGGTGIYLQSLNDVSCVGNVIEDAGAVQDDTTLAVGAIVLSNSPKATVTGNDILNCFKAGIAIAGIAGNVYGYTITGNTIDTITVGANGGYGIKLNGPIKKSTVSGNTIRAVPIGIGTPPADQAIDGCAFEGNTVDGTTSGGGFELYGVSRSTFIGNTVNGSFRDGFTVSFGSGCIFIGNQAWDGSLFADNTYAGFNMGNHPGAVLVGNHVGNTAGVGFKQCYLLVANCNKSIVTSNRAEGARTINYSIATGVQILFAGNFDAALTTPENFAMRQQAVLQGSAAAITQLLLGDSSVSGAIGTRTSGGDTFIAQNASHVLGSDTWHQSSAGSQSKLVILRINGDVEFYSAAAGTGDNTFVAFWGTAQVALVNGGRIKLAGTQVVSTRDTGWSAFGGAAGDKVTVYDPATVTLPQLAGRVKQLQAVLTTHGLIGP